VRARADEDPSAPASGVGSAAHAGASAKPLSQGGRTEIGDGDGERKHVRLPARAASRALSCRACQLGSLRERLPLPKKPRRQSASTSRASETQTERVAGSKTPVQRGFSTRAAAGARPSRPRSERASAGAGSKSSGSGCAYRRSFSARRKPPLRVPPRPPPRVGGGFDMGVRGFREKQAKKSKVQQACVDSTDDDGDGRKRPKRVAHVTFLLTTTPASVPTTDDDAGWPTGRQSAARLSSSARSSQNSSVRAKSARRMPSSASNSSRPHRAPTPCAPRPSPRPRPPANARSERSSSGHVTLVHYWMASSGLRAARPASARPTSARRRARRPARRCVFPAASRVLRSGVAAMRARQRLQTSQVTRSWTGARANCLFV
jgi:hypothetical protein